MRAILSGQAGRAMVGDGDSVWVVNVEAPQERAKCEWSDAPRLLAHADDVVELPDVSEKDALHELEQAWLRDRSLRLTLLLLDHEEDSETCKMAVECIDEHFASESILHYVANRLYSALLPSSADLGRAKQLAAESGAGRVTAFLTKLESDQPRIARVRAAWDEIEPGTFDKEAVKARFVAAVVHAGAFRELVGAVETGQVQQAWMRCLTKPEIMKLPNHRNVITAWVAPLRSSPKERREDAKVKKRRETDNRKKKRKSRRDRKPANEPKPYQKKTRVDTEMAAILAEIDGGRETLAMKYARDLVERQQSEDNEEFAVKTLCNLATEMKDRSQHSLQLQFAQWAADDFPGDVQAQTQLADAFLCFGRMEEALKQFDETVKQFPNDTVARNGRGEVLRELGRGEEALTQFDETVKQFPNDAVA
ncbi:MAG: tetratricopeptide repeat protein, partial [Planctomycetales bacterium]